ncbi:ERCC4 domain-containing protein [Pseudomonas amygdali]|nr:ERCC4 domain-containing protein [Pseudomonas amygdali]AXH60226.1 hypothetical protein PLA107_034125 [Pseudomonas amygdali pv. lachrymans str. M301315]RMT05775.1 hypothetical protein ALP54_04058 [Pseudomonas amygdali pv. lachrymans]
MPPYLRPELAASLAQQLLKPSVLDEGMRSGLFLTSPKHTGKTTFLVHDLVPALEAMGAITLYVDLGSNLLTPPLDLMKVAVKARIDDLQCSSLPSLRLNSSALGMKGGPTLAQLLLEVVDQAGTDLVLIVDEVQQAILTEGGQSMMMAFKAARDAINMRPNTPGFFLFVGVGSNTALVTDMTTKHSHAFMGATHVELPRMGEGFIDHILGLREARQNGANIPNRGVTLAAFEALGCRPEYFARALALTLKQKAAADEVLPIVVETLRSTIADMEIEKVESLGSLALEVFGLIAGSLEPVGKLFSASSVDYYTVAIGREVKTEEVQPVINGLLSMGLIMRVGHGMYAVADPEVGSVWRERKSLIKEGEGGMSIKTEGALTASELDFSHLVVDEKKIIKIYADMREQRSGVVKALQAMENVEVIIGGLPCGDYILSPEVAVERKSANDFVTSVMSGRVFEQVGRMKLDFLRPMVLIEGDPIRTRSAIDPKSVAGAISSLMTIQQISVVSVADTTETAIMLATMARHLQHGLGYDINLHPKKPKPNREAAEYVVGSLPGIGAGNATKLFSHFGSIHAVMTASAKEIMGVKGIGPKTAQRIHELIHFGEPSVAPVAL